MKSVDRVLMVFVVLVICALVAMPEWAIAAEDRFKGGRATLDLWQWWFGWM